MSDSPQLELLGLDLQGLTEIATACAQPAYRGKQLFEAVYRQRLKSLDEISTLPLAWREALHQQGRTVGLPSIDRSFRSV
ncbi:MAG TPA: 23S rRNA (adenine(2503)-C(2))-methyltransferase RlmN, partial [Terriglobales bacterium]